MILRDSRQDELAWVMGLESDPEAARFIVSWSEAQHRAALSDPDQAHLIVEKDGQAVGFVLLASQQDANRSVELRRIIVTPPGEGLGRAALALVIAHAFDDLDAHRLWLDVKVDNDRAQRAYRRAGFVAEGVLRESLRSGDVYESLLVMSLLAGERARSPGGRSSPPTLATRRDFAEIVASLPSFWGQRDVAHLHHPTAIEEFSDSALVIRDADNRVLGYLFGMILADKQLGYIHVAAVREDQHGQGHGRRLYCAFAELATQRGCRRLKAITTPTNTSSIAFHRSIGMHAHEVADYAGTGQHRVVLTRDLTG